MVMSFAMPDPALPAFLQAQFQHYIPICIRWTPESIISSKYCLLPTGIATRICNYITSKTKFPRLQKPHLKNVYLKASWITFAVSRLVVHLAGKETIKHFCSYFCFDHFRTWADTRKTGDKILLRIPCWKSQMNIPAKLNPSCCLCAGGAGPFQESGIIPWLQPGPRDPVLTLMTRTWSRTINFAPR